MKAFITSYLEAITRNRERARRTALGAIALAAIAFTGIGAAGRAHSRFTGPTVTVTPGTSSITTRFLQVTVLLCSPYPNPAITTHTFTHNGNDVTANFADVSSTLGQPASCNGPNDSWQWWQGTLTLVPGDNNFTATAYDGGGNAGSAQTLYVRPVSARSVLIMADAQSIDRTASQSGTARFTVMNTATNSATYTISVTCTGMGSCGTPSPSSMTMLGGQTAVTTVSYTAPGTVGAQGMINITASNSTPTVVSDKTWTEVNVVSAPASGAVITATGLGGSDVFDRSLCLTASAGSDLAVECGELRGVHALPMVRTLNSDRVPVLLYNSEQAHPMPIVHADVTLPAGQALPTTVEATLTVNGVAITKSWAGSDWVAGETRRISIQADAGTWNTNLYPYTLEIRRVTGTSSVLATLSGNLPVVNRSTSPFGAGWWLAGFEQLFGITNGNLLWIGADGSTRRYSTAGTNVWVATSMTRPDTIKYDGTNYVRYLPDSVKVKFDATGNHVQTVNRLGYVTSYSYATINGRKAMTAISLPVLSGAAIDSFTYNGSGQLTSVRAPHPSGSGKRVTTVTPDASTGRIASIKDPSGDSVVFGYDATVARRITSRTDRRGFQTAVTYDGGRVASHSLTLAGGATITQSYLPVETAGLPGSTRANAQPLDSAFSQIDGPRTDVVDATRAWFTSLGAISRLRNAIGRETSATYGNSTFPALPTKVRDPNRFVTEAFYNSRGLADSIRAIDPLGGQGNAKMTYQWSSVYDMPTRIISPLGTNNGSDTQFAYDSKGNRTWQQTGRDSTRVNFRYYANGLLRAIEAPGIAVDSVNYDTTLGNLSYRRSPNLALSNSYTDAVGRDTLITVPIDATHTGRVRNVFDIMDRVTKTVSWGPNMSTANATAVEDSVTVTQAYDAESNLTSVSRDRGVYWTGYAPLRDSMVYDGAARKTSELHPGRTDDFVYDPAGNVTSHTTPLGSTTFTYDPASRLILRVVPEKTYSSTACSSFISTSCTYSFPTTGASSVCIPADTAYYGYDAANRVIRADNPRSRVHRTYKPNGLIATDTLIVRTYYSSGISACELEPGGNGPSPVVEWTSHRSTLVNSYDLDNRRTQLVNPLSTITYSYDTDGRGLLTGVSESGFTSSTVRYDAAGRIKSLGLPGSVSDVRTYASTGFLTGRTVTTGSGTIISDALTYDLRGLLLSAATGYRRGQSSGLTAQMAYNGLGALVRSSNDLLSSGQSEDFRPDAIGNRLRISRPGFKPSTDSDFLGVRYMTYDPQARLIQVNDSITSPDNFDLVETYSYDAAGTMNLQYIKEWNSGTGFIHDAMKSYPSIDDKINVVNRHIGVSGISDESFAGHHGVYQENWYDALGRRILVRAQKPSNCSSSTFGDLVCKSYIERTIWDGDQILIERRADGAAGLSSSQLDQETSSGDVYGEVISLNGPGLDAPLAVRKTSRTTVAPFANALGDYEIGTTANGTPTTSCSGGTTCPLIDWPGWQENADGLKVSQAALNTWWGNLITEKADASGLKYMRNRYYNPQTGQFTQQDPIGLAGGLNLYGFAGGDPVNFSDPFGLCLVSTGRIPCAVSGIAIGSVVGGTAGLTITVACSTVTFGICTAAGPGLVAVGAGIGSSIGGMLGAASDIASPDAISPPSVQMGRLSQKVGKWILIGLGVLNPNPTVPEMDVRKINRTGHPDVEQESEPEKKKDRGAGEPPNKK